MAVNYEKQQEILDFISRHYQEKGYPPTIREICDGVGLKSPSTVHGYLKRLEKKGALEKDPSTSRSIRLPESGQEDANVFAQKPQAEYLEVPVLGNISAGLPILAEENVQRTFPLPMDFARKGEVFMLRVKGESMVNAGILDGDYVIVQKQDIAPDGTIVAALIDDSATVKTFYRENGYFRLQPENDFMEPIICDHVSILGRVVGVYRML